MAEKKMVRLYNKGKRSWEDAGLPGPGKTKEVPEDVAEKYVSGYPSDFLIGGPGAEGKSTRALKAENEKLKAELEALKAKKAPASKKKSSEDKEAE